MNNKCYLFLLLLGCYTAMAMESGGNESLLRNKTYGLKRDRRNRARPVSVVGGEINTPRPPSPDVEPMRHLLKGSRANANRNVMLPELRRAGAESLNPQEGLLSIQLLQHVTARALAQEYTIKLMQQDLKRTKHFVSVLKEEINDLNSRLSAMVLAKSDSDELKSREK